MKPVSVPIAEIAKKLDSQSYKGIVFRMISVYLVKSVSLMDRLRPSTYSRVKNISLMFVAELF